MEPHAWFVDDIELRDYRHMIETVNSQREKIGVERLHTRTNPGFEVKVHASIITLACTNIYVAIKVIFERDPVYCIFSSRPIPEHFRSRNNLLFLCDCNILGYHLTIGAASAGYV